MRAVPVTPRQVITVCGQCPSLHAEGLRRPWLAIFRSVYLPITFRECLTKTTQITNRPKDWLEPSGETKQELGEESQCVATLQLGPVLLSNGKSDFSAWKSWHLLAENSRWISQKKVLRTGTTFLYFNVRQFTTQHPSVLKRYVIDVMKNG